MSELDDLRLKDYVGHMLQSILRIEDYIEEYSELEF